MPTVPETAVVPSVGDPFTHDRQSVPAFDVPAEDGAVDEIVVSAGAR